MWMMTMLELSNLSVVQDGRRVVDNVTLSVKPGQVTALLGANGAGKSELVLGIAGLLQVTAGTITADGRDITNAKPDLVRSLGVAAVPEGHQVLTVLSVEDNLMAAASQLSLPDARASLNSVFAIFPELAERRKQLAGSMSGGQQQMLAIGHALMVKPRYLLIDEMSLGLAPIIVTRLVAVVKQLVASGTGVLLVEQFVEVALSLADRVVVLRKGSVRLDERPDVVRANRELLKQAYL
jgi:branched-chain amino acid transport system ATP-binding protein